MDGQPSFEDYRTPKSRRSGRCRLCDGPGQGRVVVTLQGRKEHPERTAKDANRMSYPSIDSTSATFCEPCAIKVYEAAKAAMDGATS